MWGQWLCWAVLGVGWTGPRWVSPLCFDDLMYLFSLCSKCRKGGSLRKRLRKSAAPSRVAADFESLGIQSTYSTFTDCKALNLWSVRDAITGFSLIYRQLCRNSLSDTLPRQNGQLDSTRKTFLCISRSLIDKHYGSLAEKAFMDPHDLKVPHDGQQSFQDGCDASVTYRLNVPHS